MEEIEYLKKQWLYKTIAIVVILGCIIGVVSSSVTYYVTLYNKKNKFIASTYDVEKGNKIAASDSIEEISSVLTAFAEIIDTNYIGEIDEYELVTETIKGFVNGIGDKHSEYMTKEEWEKYQEDSFGEYNGVGIRMIQDEEKGYILVSSVIKDSPAEAAGIQKDDYIVGVNGESIYKVDSDEVVKKIRGEAGTEVTLNILRGEENLEFKLKRAALRAYHVESKMFEDNIGYVYLYTFDAGCADEFEEVVDGLVEQGAKKLIIDLRVNTGGEVSQALKILDLFLEKGQIELITKSATGPEVTISSETDKKYSFENVVILTEKYTASSSEILTGALVDNGIAKTVGSKTYGKGVMQSILTFLKDGSILKLTTQEYKTPNGTTIEGVGITPDYEVELDLNNTEDNQLEKAKEILK